MEHMSFSYFDEANVQFPCGVTSLQVTSDVDVIVSYNACDEVRRRDPLRSLSSHKHSLEKLQTYKVIEMQICRLLQLCYCLVWCCKDLYLLLWYVCRHHLIQQRCMGYHHVQQSQSEKETNKGILSNDFYRVACHLWFQSCFFLSFLGKWSVSDILVRHL